MAVFTGTTIEEAKEKARVQLKPTINQTIEFMVLQQPRHGFLGIGRRQAQVDAVIKDKEIAMPSLEEKDRQPVKEPEQKPASLNSAEDELDPAEIKRRQEANLKKVQATSKELIEYLTTVFKELGITVEPRIINLEAHDLKIDLQTEENGRVIGKHGRRINAMEQLSNIFMDYHGAAKVNVELDTSNYRERRQETVHNLAQKAAMEVVASGKAVFMDPMPARERKQIHHELENNHHVKTYSHGREPYRSIVIAPKD
ncbi:RNA-binding cell elongation regulator Jag/EloR [Limosilactobacillus reuteri]|uniref:RNA-binding cell elongation regulator Jag/EloR n=1 Tax=Limosilactobacillus reuteri TaxID=1598 RepID=UPI00129A81C8|nr:RNA-binding cell elongation regulator Jag/EloR [Limosilactobacillus reuteri]MCR1862470.1 Jag N-terminal domain-containing protein [Limosilactobacillus reuteri]MCR1892334.1 Jag N-terminal domain-containing protein [Limosilactobacillus reuteri]MRH31350.1 KH domain-containing protein [Limosilactobacillus reuteri]